VVHAIIPTTQEAEIGGSQFEASCLSYLKNKSGMIDGMAKVIRVLGARP
jgi:hypothetical protein